MDAGEVLAALLCALPAELLQPARVIDIGCGCGLAGLTAAALGAAHTTLTDQVTFMAERNLDANFSAAERRGRIDVRALEWGDAEAIAAAGPPFDLLVASDIIYVAAQHRNLARTIAALSGRVAHGGSGSESGHTLTRAARSPFGSFA